MFLPRPFKAQIGRAQRALGLSKSPRRAIRVQEASGVSVSISPDLAHAADHASSVLEKHYLQWRNHDRFDAWGLYRRQYFTIAVGGGNTLKAQYQVMVDKLGTRIDWVAHTRFFFLEDSTGEGHWESPERSLTLNFIVPLARKLIAARGLRAIARELEIDRRSSEDDVIDCLIATLTHPIDMAPAKLALKEKNTTKAMRLARAEALRYTEDIQNKLGATMGVHFLLSGIGKDGALGALTPYLSQLEQTESAVTVIKRPSGALRVAFNRPTIINAQCISLIVSGNLKLRALGRLEMEESADFEQTVMETPLRMLRASPDIAKKVVIFADETALHFDETVFHYTENSETRENKAETREGSEKDGPHILLMHGFMGLFSFTSFLIRLPSAWTVSALHRGNYAKTLPEEEIFPHYARVLRKAILKLWNQGRAVPIAGHSIAGVISDHLLLSLLDDYDAPIKPYKSLAPQDRKLVDALRTSGMINLATWAPSDGPHAGQNIQNVVSHYRKGTQPSFTGFDRVYQQVDQQLQLAPEAAVQDKDALYRLGKFLKTPVAEPLVNSVNRGMRQLLNNPGIQQRMLNVKSPYVLRLVGNRLLKTASFYGLVKEVNAALHNPILYQNRHLKALDILLEYDIPLLCIVHEDDFLVSAQRHKEEHRYLVSKRKEKEGVSSERDLQVTARYVKLKRATEELPMDFLNPHLLIMATSNEGNAISRRITSEVTRFVNENLEKAAKKRRIKSLASVRKWRKEHPLSRTNKGA